SHPRCRGFTLLEMVVVIGIITVLAALILPAVQKARSAVQRVGCASNLRQIGIAAHHYHYTQGSFPAGIHVQQGNYLSSWLTDLLPYIEQEELGQVTQNAYA